MREIVKTQCPECREADLILVSSAGLAAWRHGELIQRALPELTDTQREQLITGICGVCWDDLFLEHEDDEGDVGDWHEGEAF